MSSEKQVSREVRIILDRRASASGRRTAAELCAKYGRRRPPDLIKAAEFEFEDATRRVLRNRREGKSEGLISHLVELWNMAFMVGMRRQLRSGGKGSSDL